MFSGDAAWQDRSDERLGGGTLRDELLTPLLFVCLETCSTGKEVSEPLDEFETQEKCQSRRTAFCPASLKAPLPAVFSSGKRPQNASKSPLA